jgi:hypothetical protein
LTIGGPRKVEKLFSLSNVAYFISQSPALIPGILNNAKCYSLASGESLKGFVRLNKPGWG